MVEAWMIQGGALGALLFLLVALGLTLKNGGFVPAAQVDRMLKRHDDELTRISTERDAWRQAFEKSQETNHINARTAEESARQVQRLLSVSETTERMVMAIRDRLERERPA